MCFTLWLVRRINGLIFADLSLEMNITDAVLSTVDFNPFALVLELFTTASGLFYRTLFTDIGVQYFYVGLVPINGKSSINAGNSSGPSMEPCGITIGTDGGAELFPQMTSIGCLSSRYDVNNFKHISLTPKLSNFINGSEWFMVSNALQVKKYCKNKFLCSWESWMKLHAFTIAEFGELFRLKPC